MNVKKLVNVEVRPAECTSFGTWYFKIHNNTTSATTPIGPFETEEKANISAARLLQIL